MVLLDILFPKRCVGCGRLGAYFCKQCTSIIRIIERNETICPMCEKPAISGFTHPRCKTTYGIDGLTSFFHYDGVVKKAIKAMKYRYVRDLIGEFGQLASNQQIAEATLVRHTLIPTPLYVSRLKERGFNQAEKLGRVLAARLNIPVRTDILRRTQQTVPQASMKTRGERLGNMKNAFSVDVKAPGRPKTVLLFDDVFTTGATMRAAAMALKRKGIGEVWAVTMAR